jgi:hypothetical protein
MTDNKPFEARKKDLIDTGKYINQLEAKIRLLKQKNKNLVNKLLSILHEFTEEK